MFASFAILSKCYSLIRPLASSPCKVCPILSEEYSADTLILIRLQPNGPVFTGPPSGIAATYNTSLPDPVTLTSWVTDEGPKINVPEPPAPGRGRGRNSAGAAASFVPISPRFVEPAIPYSKDIP